MSIEEQYEAAIRRRADVTSASYYRAKLRSLLYDRLGGPPGIPCSYCQGEPGDWCETDCGSPFPIRHPDYREEVI